MVGCDAGAVGLVLPAEPVAAMPGAACASLKALQVLDHRTP